jgi:hypothetical protein
MDMDTVVKLKKVTGSNVGNYSLLNQILFDLYIHLQLFVIIIKSNLFIFVAIIKNI